MGTIYERGQTLWIKYYRAGKAYRESTHSTKEVDAKHLLKLREGEIAEGKLPGVYFDKVRFDELAEGFLADYRINGRKSLARAQLSVRYLETFFEGMRVVGITTPRIQAYIEKRLREGSSNASINRELAALKRMLNLGARQTPPRVNRVPYIPLLKENNTRKGFFEYGEFLALRESLAAYLRGFVTFAYKTGWRLQEILALTWPQVDLQQGIVRIEPGESKNDEGRTVYLGEELKEVFKKPMGGESKERQADPLRFAEQGRRWPDQELSEILGKGLREGPYRATPLPRLSENCGEGHGSGWYPGESGHDD